MTTWFDSHFLEKRQEQCGHLSFGGSQKDPHDEGLLRKDYQQASHSRQ